MKVIEIKVGRSINSITNEKWYRADVSVSLDEGENPDDVFAALKQKVDEWLPEQQQERWTDVHTGETVIVPHSRKKASPEIVAAYREAVRSGDEEKAKNILSIYEI